MKILFFLFGYACCLANVLPLLFSSLHLLYFVPFLVIALYRCPLNQALWWSFACGLFLDLFASQTSLGTYALTYCLATFCLYGYKTHFFEDRQSTLPVMIFCYTCLSNVILGALLLAIAKPFHFSWEWVRTDLLLVPLATSIYGVLAFKAPWALFRKMRKRVRQA